MGANLARFGRCGDGENACVSIDAEHGLISLTLRDRGGVEHASLLMEPTELQAFLRQLNGSFARLFRSREWVGRSAPVPPRAA